MTDFEDDESTAADENAITLPIYFRGSQWAVTGYGIECIEHERQGRYYIPKKELGGIHNDGLPMWPMHMADKNWVDLDDFFLVFEKAITILRVNVQRFPDDWRPQLAATLPKLKRERQVSKMIKQRAEKLSRDPYSYTWADYSAAAKQLVAEGRIETNENLFG